MRHETKRMSAMQVGATFQRWIAAAAMTSAMAIACGGCAYFVPSTKLEREPADKWYAQDLPVPEGFVMDRDSTRIHDRGHRDLKLVYRRDGYVDVDRAEEFFKSAYVARGWQVRFVTGTEQRKTILWKGDEECRITIGGEWGSRYVWAVVEVEPKDPNNASGAALAKKVG